MYWQLTAEFRGGWVDSCELYVFLSRSGGACDALIDDPQWFYPDGTWGPRPWIVDPSSPTGWSIEPDPCDVLTDADYQEWQAYLEADPTMTDAELQAGLTHPSVRRLLPAVRGILSSPFDDLSDLTSSGAMVTVTRLARHHRAMGKRSRRRSRERRKHPVPPKNFTRAIEYGARCRTFATAPRRIKLSQTAERLSANSSTR